MALLRIVFFGTPEFAVPSLRALLDGEDEVVGVVCQPDKPAGRGHKLGTSPIKDLASARALPVLQPPKLRAEDAFTALRELRPDLIVVAAYGKILPPSFLTLPRLGCINVHASLLPKYRGAAPIQWAILHGETVTGITVMQMNEGMDTGDVLLQSETPIGDDETYGELQTRLADLGAAALQQALSSLKRGELHARPQDDAAATAAPMIQKEDGRIDWSRRAIDIARAVRAYNPWPSATTTLDGTLLKIHRAHVMATNSDAPGTVHVRGSEIVVACGERALRIEQLQLAGRKSLSAAEFLHGGRIPSGARLG
ncbi:MAG: methionyl-tRNA formyltransferase [Deltaproteobacteria bacterium]|nr:methionyl-tRNA formyltransferase [Deltaproteobacteria bacterium]MBI3386407.1 methionyl-tRNA formyltransferase [Deltaproteobacteria bacterium]